LIGLNRAGQPVAQRSLPQFCSKSITILIFCATARTPAPVRARAGELDCILVARDRRGQTADAVVGRGALTAAQLVRHLLPRLDRQALLVSDGHGAYRRFAHQYGIAHQAVNLRAGVRVRRAVAGVAGAIHVQNVNAYHGRFRQWLSRFRGVASR
jgi:hypothetical protein